MANYHYLAAVFSTNKPPETAGIFLAPARDIIGSLYLPSRKQAQQYLDLHHPGAQALRANACTKNEQEGTYQILTGCPTNNDRGAGRKSTGHTITLSLSGLSDPILAKLKTEAKSSNRSAYLVGLVEADLHKLSSISSIGHEIEKNGNLILYEILAKICKKHQTYWIDSALFVNTEYGEYQGTDHPTVLLAAIEDAIDALNTREPLIVDDYEP
jgi:hypothetical protein